MAVASADPEFLDLYMIAFPIAWKNSGKHVCDVPKDASGRVQLDYVPLSETWGAMEELVDAGLAKSIGLANFSSQLISDLLSYCRSGNTMNS
jgi:diketogulonate reductase-like aldo/keto reductase